MTIKTKITNFFKLNGNDELFIDATSPKSCGGTSMFKFLALKGDKILDLALIDIITKKTFIDTGLIREEMMRFHNERTLHSLGLLLGINELMTPFNSNHSVTKEDIKESVEALLYASFKSNGMDEVTDVVQQLYDLAAQNNFMDENYVGKLQEILQQAGSDPPVYKFSANLGSAHDALFYCEIEVIFNEQTIKMTSDNFKTKDKAKRYAAEKVLYELGYIDEIQPVRRSSEMIKEEYLVAMRSIDDELIIFESLRESDNNKQVILKLNTGEKLTDWMKKKADKNPFGMLIDLSARVDGISGASWITDLKEGCLALVNVQINDDTFFEVGHGRSRTKARKDAARKMIDRNQMFRIIEERYPGIEI